MKLNGWEQLLCHYFAATCISVLLKPLEKDGFKLIHTESDGTVVFKRFDFFIEIGYEVETAPNYLPTVVVGFGDTKFDKTGKPTGVPLWFLLQDDNLELINSFWRFSSEQQLLEVLSRIKKEIIDCCVRPYWEHPESLQKAVTSFCAKHVRQ